MLVPQMPMSICRDADAALVHQQQDHGRRAVKDREAALGDRRDDGHRHRVQHVRLQAAEQFGLGAREEVLERSRAAASA